MGGHMGSDRMGYVVVLVLVSQLQLCHMHQQLWLWLEEGQQHGLWEAPYAGVSVDTGQDCRGPQHWRLQGSAVVVRAMGVFFLPFSPIGRVVVRGMPLGPVLC